MRWWAGLAGLAIVGVIGLIAASRASTGVGEATDVILAILAVAAIFLLIKQMFDDGKDRFFPDMGIRDDASRLVLAIILGLIALGGFLGAAKIGGEFYVTGLALAIVATGGVFLTIKGYFDRK